MPQLKLNLSADQIDSILKQLRYGKYTAENFDIDLCTGLNGEVQALDILQGSKIEVKTDFKAHKTGNIAIEIESFGKPSGLQTSEAEWWLFNIRIHKSEPMLLIISRHRLKEIASRYILQGKTCMGGDKMASKLVIVPISEIIVG